MDFLEEIIASRKVGYRKTDPSHSGWQDMGIENALKQRSYTLRYQATMNFVMDSVELENLKRSRVLDTGEYNPFSKWLKDEFGIVVQNTSPEMDFDYSYRNETDLGKFDFIFALEIIEHLMNPLVFLEFLQKCLSGDGKIFLSTPFSRPRFLWSKYHITEYFPDKIEILANKAGLRIMRYRVKKIYDYRYALAGIRPFFRALWFDRIMFFELTKQ